jgi:hypothetical protein
LVSPSGVRHYFGATSRKSGSKLLETLAEHGKEIMELMGSDLTDETTHKKTTKALTFSNGWVMTFGGTIRQEASEAHYQASKTVTL